MNNPDIRRYERELGRAVRGVRQRKRMRAAFRRSLLPLLEEKVTPTYVDLNEAFGPPEFMAQDLIDTIPDLPKPFSLRQKIGIATVFCFVVAVTGIAIFSWINGPEDEVILLDGNNYAEEMLVTNYLSRLSEEFDSHDYTWKQSGKEYLLLVDNTNQISTTISVKYSNYQTPHTFVVPAGEKRIFQVTNARSTEHVVSFDTLDGSLSGRIKVLIPRTEE